jgi:hypothetical protein
MKALYNNTIGRGNVAVGIGALFHNIDGFNLVAIGDSALFNSDNSNTNVAIGTRALFSSVLGARRNTALGTEALLSNTFGSDNMVIDLVLQMIIPLWWKHSHRIMHLGPLRITTLPLATVVWTAHQVI